MLLSVSKFILLFRMYKKADLYESLSNFLPVQMVHFGEDRLITDVVYDSMDLWPKREKDLYKLVHNKDHDILDGMINGIGRVKSRRDYLRIRGRRKKGYRWMDVRIIKNGEEGYQWISADVDMMKSKVEKYAKEIQYLKSIAYNDPLTGLLNRRGLRRELKKVFKRKQEIRVGVIYVDIDNLKKANDEHGHDYGDKVIYKVASSIKEVIRESDIASRMGGDEMVIVVPEDRRSTFSPKKLGKRLQEVLGESSDPKVTASIGIASFNTKKFLDVSSDKWDNMLRRELSKADHRSREAKKLGKNRTV